MRTHLLKHLFFMAPLILAMISNPVAASSSSEQDATASFSAVINEKGDQRYIVLLKEGLVEATDARDEPPARHAMDPANASDIYGWHRPKARKSVKALEKKFGLKALTMTSHALPAFSAFIPADKLEQLRDDPIIEEIVPVPAESIQFSSWADTAVLGSNGLYEVVPWGKQAIGTHDGLDYSNSPNIVYMIDGAAMMDGTTQPHPENNIVPAPINDFTFNINPTRRIAPGHANHVAGILGARMNNGGVRGVNPGMMIINVGRGEIADHLHVAMDWVLWHSELLGIFATANLSSNWPVGYAHAATSNRYMRRLSNRVLVVQSAGNRRGDACTYAFGPSHPNDGILVVGGIEETGSYAVTFDNTASGSPIEPGTNFGSCVEVWAPAQRVYSTWKDGLGMTLSGTSMSAPHVAALAARHGDWSTRPVERENFIRSKLFATGFVDEIGTTIRVPSFSQPSSFVVPTRLPVVDATADAWQADSPPMMAADGLFLTGMWNAGHGVVVGVNTAWIRFDLGSSKTVKSMRLTPEVSQEANATHHIYIGNSPDSLAYVGSVSGQASILESYFITLNHAGRYVQVTTVENPGWVAWREIEIFGY